MQSDEIKDVEVRNRTNRVATQAGSKIWHTARDARGKIWHTARDATQAGVHEIQGPYLFNSLVFLGTF